MVKLFMYGNDPKFLKKRGANGNGKGKGWSKCLGLDTPVLRPLANAYHRRAEQRIWDRCLWGQADNLQ